MGFLGGAALLTAAVAVSKLLGALYKIPLGNLLGSRGMGCFQAAYNVYGVLLTLSTAGLPLAMSRLIAQSRGRPRRQRRIFHVALALFLALGLVGSGVMLTFPRQLAGLLHNELAAPSIRVLAPALLAVCLLSAIRGYTQGQGQMLPTAVSQVVESAGKLVVGLGLTWYLLTVRGVSPEIGAAGAMAGVTAGSLLALLVLALLVSLSSVGIDLTVLSVFGGALGVGIGFGMQKIASNYISGFIILFDRSVKLGDYVQVANFAGVITQINTRYSVISNISGQELIVPNENFVTGTVMNYSRTERESATTLEISCAYESDVDRALAIFSECIKAQPRVLKTREPWVVVSELAASGITLKSGFWVTNPENGTAVLKSNILREVLRRFAEEKIEIPYNKLDLTVKNAADFVRPAGDGK